MSHTTDTSDTSEKGNASDVDLAKKLDNESLKQSATTTNTEETNPIISNDSSLSSTISHLVGNLSPTHNETTSVSQVNVTTSTSSPNSKNTDAKKNSSLEFVTETTTSKPVSLQQETISHIEPKINSIPVTSIQSQPGIKFTNTDELKASFTGISNKNTDPISMVLPQSSSSNNNETNGDKTSTSGVIGGIGIALGLFTSEKDVDTVDDQTNASKHSAVKSSPLLSSTPPTVSKSLIKSYPFLILTLKVLNILTWNDDDSINLSIFLVVLTSFSILYYEPLIIYLGHLTPVFALWIYSECKAYVKDQQIRYSTLDDVIQTMTQISKRAEILISPIVELDLSSGDLKRLLFTTVFLSPVYVVISFFILPPNKMFLILNILVLTYHSKWSKITRALLWKSRTFRLLCFYLTGLDFENSGLTKASTLFNLNKKLSNRFSKNTVSNSGTNNFSQGVNSKSSVRFTYVIYENQRRWLGVGWTPNLLSYERTPWTDEFLNESEPIESFELPQLPLSIDLQDENGDEKVGSNDEEFSTKGMVWRWIDKTWRLDLTNDGSIQLPSTKPKTTANPKSDDGWIYYDNTWKNPITEDGFSKYTRRRRWIRTAELVYIGTNSTGNKVESVNNSSGKEVRISNDITTEKSTRFGSADISSLDAESNDNGTQSDDDKRTTKAKKGGLKKSDEKGQVKQRKSLRFEEPAK